jgi:hypothetical protein
MGETYEAPRPKSEDIKKYRETKDALHKLLIEHRENIHLAHPVPTMNDGSYEMALECDGLNEINRLIKRFTPINYDD